MRTAACLLLLTSGFATAGTELVADEKALHALLQDEKLVERFGTVGYPLADEVKLDGKTCAPDAWFELGFHGYEQMLRETPFAVRLQAPIALHANQASIGTRVLAWPTVEMFGDFGFAPVGTLVEAYTHEDGTNSIDAQIHAMGFVVDVISARVPHAMTYERSFGYQVPVGWGLQFLKPEDLGLTLTNGQSFAGSISFAGHLAGKVIVAAAPSGVQVRTMLLGVPTADISAQLGSWVSPGFVSWSPLDYQLDVMAFVYGSRVQLLPRADGTWVADVAAGVAIRDAMGMTVENVLDDKGNPIRELVPLSYDKNLDHGCKLEPKFKPVYDPKADPKLSTKP